MNKKTKFLKNLISYILPILLFIFLFYYVDRRQILNTLKNANIFWFLIASCAFGAIISVSAVRAKIIIGQPTNSIYYFLSNSVSSLVRNTFPSRSGEVSYPLMWKKYCNVPISLGTATLITTRVYDFLILMLIYLVGFILYHQMMPEFFQGWWFFLLIGSFSFVLILILYLPRTRLWRKKIRRNADSLHDKKTNLWGKILQRSDSLFESFENIYSRKLYLSVFFISCILIFFRFFFIYSTIRSVGYKLGLHEIVLMSFLLLWTKVIQTVGNLGTHEAGIAGALIMLGVAKNRAISIAISMHLLQFVPMVVLAFFSYVILLGIEKKFLARKATDAIRKT